MKEDNRTEAELIREAWLVQDACNLSGVVFSFARAMERLCTLVPRSTGERNQHIVSKLFASKIMSLTGDLPIQLPAECFQDTALCQAIALIHS